MANFFPLHSVDRNPSEKFKALSKFTINSFPVNGNLSLDHTEKSSNVEKDSPHIVPFLKYMYMYDHTTSM